MLTGMAQNLTNSPLTTEALQGAGDGVPNELLAYFYAKVAVALLQVCWLIT